MPLQDVDDELCVFGGQFAGFRVGKQQATPWHFLGAELVLRGIGVRKANAHAVFVCLVAQAAQHVAVTIQNAGIARATGGLGRLAAGAGIGLRGTGSPRVP